MAPTMGHIGRRLSRKGRVAVIGGLGFDPITRTRLDPRGDWVHKGSPDYRWAVPARWTAPRPIAYCVGAGEDISFDIALAREYEAQVVILDPTPRSVTLVQRLISDQPSMCFRPFALWTFDGEVWLHEPQNPAHVSHSIVNLQGTSGGFRAQCRRLESVMWEWGHSQIDLLKLDVEGAEYDILTHAVGAGIRIGIIDVEFDELSWPAPGYRQRIRDSVAMLKSAGYQLCRIDMSSNYTFMHEDYSRAGWT